MINIPLKDIPFLLKEGDVIEINGNSYKFDAEETKKKKKKIEDMTKGLWEQGKINGITMTYFGIYLHSTGV